MTRVVGILSAVVLFGLGGLHAYWAAGGRWATDVTIPKRDGTPLFTPDPASTLFIAVLLFIAAAVLLGRVGIWGQWLPRWPFVAGTWTLAVVFGARVVGDFQWFGLFKRRAQTPFARWDTWLYVPLCLLLAGAALLVACSEP